jgi:tetratricopeptide (TPR) repeat protein
MRQNKKAVLCAIFCAFILTGCGVSAKTIKRMQMLEEGVSSPTTEKELQDAIAKYGKRVEDVIQAQMQIGIWYKILATRYLDNKMYGEALKTFQKAIEFYPDNANLYYYVGLCAGYMAQSALDYNATGLTSQKFNYLKLSESSYLRALELEPRYTRTQYSLAVLYVFELDEPAKAVPLLETLLTIDKKHIDAMFVLARAYYSVYQFDKAVAMYDQIIANSTSQTRKDDAAENKRQVLEAYGG